MSQLSYPPVQEALNLLKDLSVDPETRYRAQVRELALRDELTQIALAEQRGRQEGKEEGKQETLEFALGSMISSGMTEAQARKILGLS